ncbi:alginate lyase family protein [Bacteroides nordii]|uniref:alginate lyase family protein n=1 Tax=Bacteroides nordii TaxID=291645 RepID=UPI00210CFDDD|nr:alginate lyase family protein [Bacteroides nordii]MCQ4914356.1 alginate lyase family protein [Bacteroides nordii]
MKCFYYLLLTCFLFSCAASGPDPVVKTLRQEILKRAEQNLAEKPVTVTSFIAERSMGGSHDFFSEGDYWWPDSLNPDGPYIRRDGETNPDNFVAHRHAMVRFSVITGNLTSAYLITQDKKYTDVVLQHIRAWFVNKETRMNPNLLYAQAIKGIATGRGIGIIDTVHLIEVAQSLLRLQQAGVLPAEDAKATKEWFASYLNWMVTHPYGMDEMKAKNNHGTCWVMQVAMFAKYTEDEKMMKFCSDRYKEVLLPGQMAEDGSFPLEQERTKPYAYSLFNLDAMTMICQILSTNDDNLWQYTTADGRNIMLGISYLYPFVADKSKWTLAPDVMCWEEWPVAHPFLLFGSAQLKDEAMFDTWLKLEHFPTNNEVVRNLPIRNPIIWL